MHSFKFIFESHDIRLGQTFMRGGLSLQEADDLFAMYSNKVKITKHRAEVNSGYTSFWFFGVGAFKIKIIEYTDTDKLVGQFI